MTSASPSYRRGVGGSSGVRARGLASILPGLALLAVAACSDTTPPAPTAAVASPSRAVVTADAGALFECAAAPAASASRVITPAGGILAAGGHAIAIPRGAVASPTRFTMTVPASRYVEVEIRAEGAEHYQFQRPVVVTLDYSRCGATADLVADSFTAWYVQGGTRSFLADMGGVDDRFTHRLFFSTDHLSGYAVAYRSGTQPEPEQ